MIINDELEVYFFHIPKCGGSTIRRALSTCDSTQGYFTNKIKKIDDIEVDFVHLPFDKLKIYEPEIYDRIKNYQGFALIRNPEDRFISAINQYLKKKGKDRGILNTLQIIEEIDLIIDKIRSYSTDAEFIHFLPQNLFIKHCPNDIKLFLVEDNVRIVRYLQSVWNIDVDLSKKDNVAKVYKNRIYKIIWSLGKVAIPECIRKFVRKFAIRLFMRNKKAEEKIELKKYYHDFCQDFYKNDFDLYQKLIERNYD